MQTAKSFTLGNPKVFSQSGLRYLALLIKDNAVPVDECFCQFASIDAVTEGLESIKISKDAFIEVAAYLLGEFLVDDSARLNLFYFMDMDRDGLLGIHDWRGALASAEYWMSDDGNQNLSAIKIQSAWRGHFERSALITPASAMFTIETVFQPMENQKYWEDEDEEIFFNHIPATVIDESLSAHDVLSAMTALAHPKGLTAHTLFVYICKSSAFDPDKAFVLDDFVEGFLNLCSEKLTDPLYEVLSQAFNQLLDLNGDGAVSYGEFLWVMRQYFEAQHAATWTEVEPTYSVERSMGAGFVVPEPESVNKVVSLVKNEANILGTTVILNESRTATAQLYANETVENTQNTSSRHVAATSSPNTMKDLSPQTNMNHSAAAIQIAEAVEQAAQLKRSSEAAAAIQLADAAATKLAAEKLFAEAQELKKTYEAAAAKQIADASSIKLAAEVAHANRDAQSLNAVLATGKAPLKLSSESAASKHASKFSEANVSSTVNGSKENYVSTKASIFGTEKPTEPAAIVNGSLNDASNAAHSSLGSAPISSTASKHTGFDPRALVHNYDFVNAEMTSMGANVTPVHNALRPSSSGDQYPSKSVRFSSNRPSTSDGSGNSQKSISMTPTHSYAPQTHQSRQPNSQQQFVMKIEDENLSSTKRSQERPSTSDSYSSDHSSAIKPHQQISASKLARPEFTKRVLLVEVENACTWVRTCAQKIGSRFVNLIKFRALQSVYLVQFHTPSGFSQKV
jgi:hypothetical protein